jgi:aminoglycoside 6'-N-acetyltransferase I
MSGSVRVRAIVGSDLADWVRLREALWPGSLSDHDAEARRHFAAGDDSLIVFGAELDGRLVGFLELDFRTCAPGCRSSPVPFIEGWFVEPRLRGQGIGRALVRAAEDRARSLGYDEIASDAEIENGNSISAHRALGYEEIERIVCFRRRLTEPEM